LAGDSIRTLRGTFAFDYQPLWRAKDKITLSLAPATGGITAGSHYAFPLRRRAPGGFSVTFDGGADYTLARNVRLGTKAGPLVSLEHSRIGVTYTMSRQWASTSAGAISVNDQLGVSYRDLRSTGAPAFLGGVDRTHGPALSNTLTLGATTVQGTGGHWEYGLQWRAVEWLSHPAAFFSHEASASVRWINGSANAPRFIIELRGGAGEAGRDAPRIAFWRLGGDTWLRGMQDGELAGRRYRVAAFEAGPCALSLWRLISPPSANQSSSLLKGLFLTAFVERGRVQGQSGTDFNSSSSASSFGLNVRGFGLIPGGSLAAGYAWSPAAIRPRGRFFISMIVLFQR
jgi:hypothetical protein